MTEQTSIPQDALDDKFTQVFDGKVVRKDLVRKVKVGANVPVFVLEFLLGKYCASSDDMAIQMGLKVVNDTLGRELHPARRVHEGTEPSRRNRGSTRSSTRSRSA